MAGIPPPRQYVVNDSPVKSHQRKCLVLLAIEALPRQPTHHDLVSFYASSAHKRELWQTALGIYRNEALGTFHTRGNDDARTLSPADKAGGKFIYRRDWDGLRTYNALIFASDILNEDGGAGRYGVEGEALSNALDTGMSEY